MAADSGLTRFNTAPTAVANHWARSCLDVQRWADGIVGARPYPDRATLLAAAGTEATPLTADEIDSALARHPRIGDRPPGDDPESRMSRSEQSGVDSADSSIRRRLAEGNHAYERKFGRVFLIRAAGRSADEMLAALQRRLQNDEAEELSIVATELREIATLRLKGILDS